MQHQQEILEKLEEKVTRDAIVVYACPSFWKREDLWRFCNGSLVENSNFTQPYNLKGHHRYSFVESGKDGYACSEPRKIESFDILGKLETIRKKPLYFENNLQFLASLARGVKIVVEELNEPLRDEFFTILKTFGQPLHKLESSIVTITAFNLFANTTWGICY